jgi:hypothetical protein
VYVNVYGGVEFEPVKVMLGCAPFSQTVTPPPPIVAAGNGFIVVVILFDCPVQPDAVTLT